MNSRMIESSTDAIHFTLVMVFPNPATDGQFYLQMPGTEPATLDIYSLEGQMLYMGSIAGHTRYAIHISPNGKKAFPGRTNCYPGKNKHIQLVKSALKIFHIN